MHASLSGQGADGWDGIHAVYATLPMLAGLIISFVLLLVGVAFRSVLLPLRTTVTIAFTLIVVYGLAVLVYQDGALNSQPVPGMKAAAGKAQDWVVPVLSFPMLVGISLDYDIFLLSSIAELRAAGHDTLSAIRHGVVRTGSIITTAGVIMAIAFSGLMFSSVATCNELSFYIVVAVLFDTFIVRVLVVPAFLARLGEANWWPGRR